MATRYCGNARISLTYRDRDIYAVRVYGPESKRALWSGTIGAPAAGFGPGIAYDSPAAYDETARAAIAFADHDTMLMNTSPEVETIARYVCTECGAEHTPTRRGYASEWREADAKDCGACGARGALKFQNAADRYYVRRAR
jgi:DNA-directed RNA polymerase subunit RPC12/RpoP